MAQTAEMNRRIAGLFKARLWDFELEKLEDTRQPRGRRWPMPTLLRSLLVGLASGCQSLAEVEALTEDMSWPMRRLLGIGRRVPDTTLRDEILRLLPSDIRERLHAFVKAAHRRKQLEPNGFPFGIVAMDGKGTALPCWDDTYAQRHTHENKTGAYGLLRTVTCALVSTSTKPCIDAIPIPADTNEMGAFKSAFESLCRHYGHLFQLVTYDAGVTSQDNAQTVVDAGKDFLFHIKNENWLVLQDAIRVFKRFTKEEAAAQTEDVLSKDTSVFRYVFLAAVGKAPDFWGMPHVKTIVRVLSQKVQGGQVVEEENRYFISSLKVTGLTFGQWLSVVRNHWAVENNCHNTFDKLFREDDKPWIEMDCRGALVMMLLRRMAYSLLAIFRSRTQRSEEKRQMPWKRLFTHVYNALIAAQDEHLEGLRIRTPILAFR